MNAGRRPGHGLTLVELLVVMGIVAVLAALAAPSVSGLIARKRLEGTTNELLSDLRMARSTTTQINAPVYLKFGGTEATRCYTVYTAGFGSCNCNNGVGASCTSPLKSFTPPRELKTVLLTTASGVTFLPSVMSTTFSSLTTMTVGDAFSVDVSASGANAGLRINVNSAGLPSVCTTSGHTVFPACE